MAQGWLDSNRPFDDNIAGFSCKEISSEEISKRLGLDEEEVTHARAHTHSLPTLTEEHP